jgi:peptidoglycan/LPS O-acetylase OafA/YrhL
MGLLRLLLAVSVVVGHAGGVYGLRLENGGSAFLTHGDTAVQAFYVVSGFYMALILSGKYVSAPAFWVSRYLRLAPLYLFLSLLTFATAYIISGLVPKKCRILISFTRPSFQTREGFCQLTSNAYAVDCRSH